VQSGYRDDLLRYHVILAGRSGPDKDPALAAPPAGAGAAEFWRSPLSQPTPWQSKPGSPGFNRRDFAAFGVLVALVLGLCLYGLGNRSIWLDEAVALRIAQTPGWDAVMSDGGNMALYYLFMRAWLRAGDSLEVLRLPSVLFSAAGAGLFYLLVRRLFDTRTAVMSALFLGVNSSFVYYGQEARSYALVLLLVVAAWLALATGLETKNPGWFLLWGALNAAAVGSHLFAVLMVGAQGASLLLLGRKDLPIKWLAAGALVTSVGSAPFLLAAASRGSVQIGWIPPISAASFRQVLWFLGGNNFEPGAAWFSELAGVVVLVVVVAAAAAGTWLTTRALARYGRSLQAWRYGVAVLWLAVPLAGAVVVSATVQPLLVPRFFTAVLPAVCLLVALAVSLIPRPASLIALSLLVGLSLVGVVRSYSTGHWGWDRAAEHLAEVSRPGDPVVILPAHDGLSLGYHLKKGSAYESMRILSPRESTWRPPEPTVYGVSEAFFAPTSPEHAARQAELHDRFWLVTADYTRWDASGRVQEAWGEASGFFESLDPQFRVRSGEAAGRVGVLLVERSPESGRSVPADRPPG